MKYGSLTISDPKELIFGTAPHPVITGRGLEIGNGRVYPELNFTLPQMSITPETRSAVIDHYRQIASGALERCVELHQDGVVLEFETLLEMTLEPDLGVELVHVMNEICEEYYATRGLRSEIRLTPNDTRDFERPVKMRTSRYLENMFTLFEKGAQAGGNLLSIESTGGKEVCDEALMNCNIKEVVFSLAVLGVRDMQFLWKRIVEIAASTGRIAGGDTACGFGNTAMVLAEQKYIPRVFAAVVRIITIVRTLVALEEGAVGPDKDCGYEGPFLKAITGTPISMEGKTAACAHLSPVGNVAAAACDLWSNESVTNIKLLAAMAPTVYMEQLIYDVRLMNEARRSGQAEVLQQLFSRSDIYLDPQALILDPAHVIAISSEIVASNSYIEAAVRGALKGLEIIEEGVESGELLLEEREKIWIDMIRSDLGSIPYKEEQFVETMSHLVENEKVILSEYGL